MPHRKIFVFLTIFILLNNYKPVFAQFSQKENQQTPLYSDTLKALHYSIHLTDINLTNKTIKGYIRVKLVVRAAYVSSVKLELAQLQVDSVFIAETRTLKFKQISGHLVINLSEPLKKGETLLAAIYYHGHPYVDPSGWGGFHFAGEYALNLGVGFDAIPHNLGKSWFPCIDDFHDRALYDVYLTVPDDKKAISGGRLVDVTKNGNATSTWHWKTDYTLPTYLISATTGKYELKADTFNGQQARIPITYFCRTSDTAKTAGTFLHLKQILQIFENHFGPYPFERVGYTASPGGLGAMEHASNITYPFSGWTGSTDKEWWYAHELSHMWFGDKVTCASAEDMWLNEGWAVFCESLYREGIYGQQAYRDNMRTKLKEVLLSAHNTDGGYYAVYGIPQTITYGSTVYQKGGQVAHTLRGYMGDSLFFGGVKAYMQKYAYNYASTTNLRDFLSAYSGIDLKPFFDAWVFTPGFPHFSVDSVTTVRSEKGYDVTVFVRQKLKERTQYANCNHLEIAFMDSRWHKIIDTIEFSGLSGTRTFQLPFLPVTIMADPNEKISDATTDITKTIKAKGEYDFAETFCKLRVGKISDSALVRITYNWVAPDSLSSPHAGLRISDSHYWTVEGLFSKKLKASGVFSYSNAEGFDKTLIINANDSLVMLYRKRPGYPWKEVDCTCEGSWMTGKIIVDNLVPGEYSLAVWDRKYLNRNARKP